MPIAVALVLILGIAGLAVYLAYRFIDMRANLKFEQWKAAHSDKISRDAIRGSQSAVAGRVFERMAPYLPGFDYNPKDARFIGDPVDFIIFDGLSDGEVRNVIFVEVKTGGGTLNGNERKIRNAVKERRVLWSLFHLPHAQPELPER
jgi:predicted Holliday junction resolvase-like endonuclease